MSESKYYDFSEALRRVQEYVYNNYSMLLLENIDDNKEQLKSYIKKFLDDNGILVSGYKVDALVNRLYIEMAEYSFLSEYFDRDDIEEINVNSYDDIKITYTTGEILPSKEKFDSPIHAMDVIRRLLHQSGMILDNSQPIIVGHLSDKIRITAMAKGVVDKDVGVSVSIRIVNPRKLTKEECPQFDEINEDGDDFLTKAEFELGHGKLFGQMDTNGDVVVSMEEMVAFMKSMKKEMKCGDGKCGEGKCGKDTKAKKEMKCGDGKCGDGK